MDTWQSLDALLLLLAAAMVLGTAFSRLGQSAIVGYLLAGALVGPNALNLVRSEATVTLYAELGVATLLFTIGLEFSWRELLRQGHTLLGGGMLQILVTGGIVYLLARELGVSPMTAVVFAAMLPMSSTASVLGLLGERAALETPYGRSSGGILLLQDIMILPLTVLLIAMVHGGSGGAVAWTIGRTLLLGALLFSGILLVVNHVVPRLLSLRDWSRNREFPILLAIVLAIGSSAAAHAVGISPAMGAFLAGLLLAQSPFSVQVRADIAPLRTPLVVIFFTSIGMLSDPAWALQNWVLVLSATLAVLVLKTLVTWGLLVALGQPLGMSLATGLCIAQVGEFSFVLATIAHGNLLDDGQFRLVVAVTVLSLLATPYLVASAFPLAGLAERLRHRLQIAAARSEEGGTEPLARPKILLIGFGPAGQRVAESLLTEHAQGMMVLELNPRSAAMAERYGLPSMVGNAQQAEVLERAGIRFAQMIAITVPDPEQSKAIIYICRALNPDAKVFVRARYHAYRWELQFAGADAVVDEEEQIGLHLADEIRKTLSGKEPLAHEDHPA